MGHAAAENHGHAGGWIDRIGATGSFLCAIHCLAAPLVLALIPTLGAAAWFGTRVEVGFVLFVSVMGLLSVLTAWRRHQQHHIPATMVLGIAVLWAGILVPKLHHELTWHVLAMGTGGLLVASAHIANLRASRRHADGLCCAAEAR
ncbi:MAG: MerC domain-containing protein [Proteobacteria bacterium]|nr:MerC domain-containing protein [Pseudomonadota bacterium]